MKFWEDLDPSVQEAFVASLMIYGTAVLKHTDGGKIIFVPLEDFKKEDFPDGT